MSQSIQSIWHCNLDTGIITPECRTMFQEAAGIQLEAVDPCMPADHILNVAKKVHAAIGYVDDVNVIRKEGRLPDHEHAVGFLQYHCSQRQDVMDISRASGKAVTMIMLGGAPLPVRNRAFAAIAAAKACVNIKRLRVFVRNESEIVGTKYVIDSLFKAASLHIHPEFHVVGNVTTGLLETGLEQTKPEWKDETYMLASDPMMCNRIEMMAKKSLDATGATCAGVVSVAIKDYQQDVLLSKARTAEEIVAMTLESKIPADLAITEQDVLESARVQLWFEAKGLHVAAEKYASSVGSRK